LVVKHSSRRPREALSKVGPQQVFGTACGGAVNGDGFEFPLAQPGQQRSRPERRVDRVARLRVGYREI
jgi:hypothetical protein